MAQYDENLDLPIAFPPEELTDVFGKVLSDQGLVQLRIAETEKYAHVTFSLTAGRKNAMKEKTAA